MLSSGLLRALPVPTITSLELKSIMSRQNSIRLGTVVLSVIGILNVAGIVPPPAPAAAAPGLGARSASPAAWILGPMHASWVPEGPAAPFTNSILDQYNTHRIPLTAFHFDAWDWETCNNNAQLKYDDALIQRLRTQKVRAVFWLVPLIARTCPEYAVALQAGYFVSDAQGAPIVTPPDWWQGQGSWIDFDNPAAVAYWHRLLDPLLARTQGVFGGFYADDVRPDLVNDSSYFDAFVLDLLTYTRAHVPDAEIVFKRYGVNTADDALLSQYGHTSYVNDFPTDWAGLRQGIEHVMATAALLPAPYNEFTAYDRTNPDAETFIRRMQWGAFQPVMENAPALPSTWPWDKQYPPLVAGTYQYYATLHWELVPYLHTYDQIAFDTGLPILRNADPAHYATQLGDEFFVQYVTDYAATVPVTLPAGRWIDYWDETRVHTGPVTIQQPVPLGREPIFIADGALIPMQVSNGTTGHGTPASAGALTVNVFPTTHSTFAYFDLAGAWIHFDAWQVGRRLTLCTDAPPSQPLLYRIARWSAPPLRVGALNGAIGVNVRWGQPLAALANEASVGASGGGWFFDAERRHLVIKQSQPGASCPSQRFLRIDRFSELDY